MATAVQHRVIKNHFLFILLFWIILNAGNTLVAREVKLNGVRHVDLPDVAAQLGMKFRWLEKNKKAECSSQWTTLTFEVHKREFNLNGYRVFLGRAISLYKGRLYISKLDFEKSIKALLIPQNSGLAPKLRHIVIDPGHGGKDPGAQNLALKIKEKKLCLDVANRLRRLLQKEGFRVSLTRSGDKFIGLPQRSMWANRQKADLFISIHFNSATFSRVNGVETYVLTPSGQPSSSRSKPRASDKKSYPANKEDNWNALCGFYVQKSLVGELGAKDRGLKRARFAVLKNLNCPGILVEGGFVTHSKEARKLNSPGYREKLAQSISKGILLYQKTLNRLGQNR